MTEVKVIAASGGALVVGVLFALGNALQDNPGILAGLPMWLQFIIISTLPAILAWLGGFMKSSSTSAVSKGFVVDGTTNR